MNKRNIAIAFSIIFATFTLVPSVMSMVDESYDISVLISSAEEEEKKGEEKTKDVEIKVLSKQPMEYKIHKNRLVKALSDHSSNYSSLFKELTLPPPEHIVNKHLI